MESKAGLESFMNAGLAVLFKIDQIQPSRLFNHVHRYICVAKVQNALVCHFSNPIEFPKESQPNRMVLFAIINFTKNGTELAEYSVMKYKGLE